MATDPQTLLDAANCYLCMGTPGSWQLMKLALLKQILLALNPSAMTDPQTLLDEAKCYGCYTPGMWQLMELALLAQISANGSTGAGGVACGAADPVAAPSGTCGVYVNTTSGQIFWYFNGAWQ